MLINQTYNRLLPIINQIDRTVICQSLVNNLNGTYTFLCKDTGYLTAGYDITIGLLVYNVISFNCNVSITVKGASLPTQLTFDLYPPIYKHGTIIKVKSELNSLTDFKDRTPLIFLHEIIEEKYHFDPLDAVDTDAEVRLYFLTGCNFAEWTQLEGDTLGVQPMRNLWNRFIVSLTNSQYVQSMKSIGSVKNYNIFGNTNDNGTTDNIFNEFLSGVKATLTIPFLRDCDCCDVSLLDNRPAPSYVYNNLGVILAVLYSNEIYTVVSGGACANVSILNIATGLPIASVVSGGTYSIELLTVIEDTLTSNTTTIIDPI